MIRTSLLALLLAGFFLLEPLGVPVSAVAAAGTEDREALRAALKAADFPSLRG